LQRKLLDLFRRLRVPCHAHQYEQAGVQPLAISLRAIHMVNVLPQSSGTHAGVLLAVYSIGGPYEGGVPRALDLARPGTA
jgi:hypothetical protein